MDSCSEQAQQEVEPGNNSDDVTLLTKSVHYIRLQTWIWLAFSSLLVVLSLNSWSSMVCCISQQKLYRITMKLELEKKKTSLVTFLFCHILLTLLIVGKC
jgi:hypothetical protein